jgi:hypothetical protein
MIGVDQVLDEARSMLRKQHPTSTPGQRVRCSITNIDEYGLLSLSPRGGQEIVHHDLLTFYRDFWLRLLSNETGATTGCEHQGFQNQFRTSIETLEAIQQEARLVTCCHSEGAVSREVSNSQIREYIQRHLSWQNRLRDLAQSHSMIAPIAKYLVIYVVLARVGNLDCYQEDMKTVLRQLECGLTIMRDLLKLATVSRRVPERQFA